MTVVNQTAKPMEQKHKPEQDSNLEKWAMAVSLPFPSAIHARGPPEKSLHPTHLNYPGPCPLCLGKWGCLVDELLSIEPSMPHLGFSFQVICNFIKNWYPKRLTFVFGVHSILMIRTSWALGAVCLGPPAWLVWFSGPETVYEIPW